MGSSKKTPVYGLNEWVLSDKPMMDDFNSDNQKIEAALVKKANMGRPQIHNIEFLPDYKSKEGHAATYCKSDDNLVTVNVAVEHVNSTFDAGLHIVANLPVGFRPMAATVVNPATNTGNAPYMGFYPSGTIELRVVAPVNSAYAAIVFPAGN